MRRSLHVIAVAALFAAAAPFPAAHAQEKKPDDAPLAAKPDPAKLRENLLIPDALWKRVLDGTERGAAGAVRPIGFTSDEMKFYGGRDHLLRGIENLFRDAHVIPRDTGRITDDMLKLAGDGNVGELVQRCWALTDLPSGRMYAAPTGDDWGIEGAAKGSSVAEAARVAWDRMPAAEVGVADARSARDIARFLALPEPVARFVLRIHAAKSARWFALGVADARRVADYVLRDAVEPSGGDSTRMAARRAAWRPAHGTGGETASAIPAGIAAPWTDDANDQSATFEGIAFTLLREHDRAPTAYGSVVFLTHVTQAVAELRPWLEAGGRETLSALNIEPITIGGIRITGVGDDVHTETDGVVIDLGGKDRWNGGCGAALPSGAQLSVAIDLGGDDEWGSADAEGGIGCGIFGLGAVIDLAGNDKYTVKSDGLGRGLFGTGFVWDVAGNDSYVVKTKWGQGVAHAGVGVLLDSAGDDTYECAEQSQGMGSTLGCGLLLDLAGNDAYVCRDDGNVSAMYLNQSVAMAQGCGCGRRADIGDGRSLAGGWGLLVDGGGNDRYHAQVWSQGCGYWWGVGVLEDRGGDDVYENGKYSSGAGAHYAIGVHVDLDGNDRYNQGVAGTKNQYQGHARDASIGVFVDGGGNDAYAFRPNCAGSSDLASVGLFWDRAGDDTYAFTADPPPADGTPANTDWLRTPFGTSTFYRPANRSFRDDLPSIGVFLDTGGKDTYPEGTPAKDAAKWAEHPWPNAWGFGLDE